MTIDVVLVDDHGVLRDGVRHLLILTVASSPETIREALAAGARGYMLKESATSELIAAVRAVASGRRYLCAEVAAKAGDATAAVVTGIGGLDALTSREREILHLIVVGKSNAEAAEILGLSPRTVETYRGRMMEKLHFDDLPSLVKFAIRHGIIDTD